MALNQTFYDAAYQQYTLLETTLDAKAASFSATEADMTIFWQIFGGAMVLLMQLGFGMLEAGCVRSISVVNIIFKNAMDACIGAWAFYVIGWALAYGNDGTTSASRNGFVGSAAFALASDASGGNVPFDVSQYSLWFYQFAFCATAGTIVSGAVAERTQLAAYFIYSAWICGFVYPVVVHWCWSGSGWASAFGGDYTKIGMGLIDFAGCGVVHMVGGVSALSGALLVGTRRGKPTLAEDGTLYRPYRFDAAADPADFEGHNKVFQALGMFILWTGWYGFNCCSTLVMGIGPDAVAARVAANTTLGASGGGLAALIIDVILQKLRKHEPIVSEAWLQWAHTQEGVDVHNPPAEAMEGYHTTFDLTNIINGILAGLVSITAGCSVVEPYGALSMGFLGGVIYYGFSGLMVKLKIDDPLDAVAVHGACGYWGLVAVGFFATKDGVAGAYDTDSWPMSSSGYYGVFYGGNGKQLGVQLLLGVVIMAWTLSLTLILFFVVKKLKLLRIDDESIDYKGVDHVEHGVQAYAN